ncbi:MAG: hypothetical protein F6K17_08665 [Okeania sp. SIO3C4]|nr:hypothetical protein [Okeania sp. SIO3C4]
MAAFPAECCANSISAFLTPKCKYSTEHDISSFCSRCFNHEHRLVYQVSEKEIIIVACKYHYV